MSERVKLFNLRKNHHGQAMTVAAHLELNWILDKMAHLAEHHDEDVELEVVEVRYIVIKTIKGKKKRDGI